MGNQTRKQQAPKKAPPAPALPVTPPTQTPQAPQQNPQQDDAKKQKTWIAKVDCTYNGRRIKQGETVFAAEMKNANFEAVK